MKIQICLDCGKDSWRYLDCEECKEKGIACQEIICIECGASLPKGD